MSFKVNKMQILHDNDMIVDISYEIKESLALIGQSGSGKSLSLKALLGLLPQNLDSILKIDADFEMVRGSTISIVPQNPFTALSPLTKIKDQFMFDIKTAKRYMSMVELDDELLTRYPSELSGGQLQRVIIALALAVNPKLLLLDEPTTALDSNTKMSIIKLIKDLQCSIGFLTLFVTHDIEVAKEICKEVAILKRGEILERGEINEVLVNPKTDYAKELVSSNFKSRDFRV